MRFTVNISTDDLDRPRSFYEDISFRYGGSSVNYVIFNLSEDSRLYVMKKGMFERYVTNPVSDSNETSQVLFTLDLDSKEEVDALVGKALSAGGKEPCEAVVGPRSYWRYFQDPDGYFWEIRHSETEE